MASYRFGIVVGKYNALYTEALLNSALKNLKGHKCKIVRVPGAFEIPLQIQRLAHTRKYDALLAFGLVWQGKTAHASEILRATTDSLMRIGLENDVPVVHAVLAVTTEQQAKERTMGKKYNRGVEAAEVALYLAGLK